MRLYASLALLCAGLLATLGCEPPGKPEAPEAAAADVTDFKTLFAKNCSGCHGAEGRKGPGRILNDPLYLAFIPREELKKVLIYGRPGTAMPPWLLAQGGPLNDRQIDALVNGIYGTWAKPVDLHGSQLPAYRGEATAGDAIHGKKLFVRNCFMCHGTGARVGPVSTPSYLQLVSNQMLRTSIVVGRPDLALPMPNYQHLNAGHALADADVSDLVAYLASLRPVGSVIESSPAGEKGSGNGPGSPPTDQLEGNKHANSSQSGGTIEQRKTQH